MERQRGGSMSAVHGPTRIGSQDRDTACREIYMNTGLGREVINHSTMDLYGTRIAVLGETKRYLMITLWATKCRWYTCAARNNNKEKMDRSESREAEKAEGYERRRQDETPLPCLLCLSFLCTPYVRGDEYKPATNGRPPKGPADKHVDSHVRNCKLIGSFASAQHAAVCTQ